MAPRVILASQSPFRKRALDVLGVPYDAIPSRIDEKAIRDKNPLVLAEKLARAKATAVGEAHPEAVVIASDLFVVKDGCIFEKPADGPDAVRMLHALSGASFDIVSSLAVCGPRAQKIDVAVESCTVTFRSLSEFEVADYVQRYPVTTFAGAFDGDGMLRFAERVEGNFNFTAGLPVNKLVEFLRAHGVSV
jgi:septum formation protein